MVGRKKKEIILFIIILLISIIFSSTTYAISIISDQNYVVKGDPYYFKVCDYLDTPRVNTECISQSDITEYQLNKTCKIYVFDSSKISCEQIRIIAADSMFQDIKYITISDYKEALKKSALSAPTTKASDKAILIYAYSMLGEKNKVPPLLEQLKYSRDEKEKCWPANNCDLKETTDTIFYLSKAGLNRTDRVYQDALLWIEYKQNKVDNRGWTVQVDSDNGTNCSIFSDDTEIEKFTIINDTPVLVNLNYTSRDTINVTCDKAFCATIYDYFNKNIIKYCRDTDETFYFKMPGGCWPDDRSKENCYPGVTERALLINGLNKSSYDSGKDWILSEIDRARIAGTKLRTSDEILFNVHAYEVTNSSDVKTWILFSQNNAGSFGKDKDYTTTLFAINAFKDENSEWVRDAKKWALMERPPSGWEMLIQNILMYNIFKKNDTGIKANPFVVYSEENLAKLNFEGDFNNASNCSVIMTDALTNNSRVTLDVSNRTAQAKILLTASEDGNYGGYAIIKCGNLTLTTPVIFSRKPFLKLNFKEEYYFLENPGIINVPIEKSISTLDCDFTFNNTFKNTNIEVSSDPELMFSYDYQREETQNIDANYSCQTDEATIQKEYSFISNYYKVPPFSYFILNNKIPSGKKGILSITNTFKDNITIKLAWEQTTAVYPVVDSISLMPEQTVDLYIYQKLKITENRTEDNNLIISSKGYEQKVPFTMQLGVGYLELPSEYKIRNKIQWKYIILGIVVLLLLGIILFVGRFIFTRIQINKKNKLKEIEAQKEKETKKQKETSGMPEVIKTAPKPKQNKQMLELLMAINSSIGESDQQIIDELKKENYREEEINELLKKLKKSISDKEVKKDVSAAGVGEVKPTTTEVKK